MAPLSNARSGEGNSIIENINILMITEIEEFDILPSFQLPDYHVLEQYGFELELRVGKY